mmetsp:Transcript_4502/g.13229  ORF Transcript_4502/g.13229 Transcript_4502/m.13229 type:complete len:235 (+) Transcript_4502:71-775(+)|eukprot:CAMPEP_0168382956 /NCGR_PEP_ID=MMETSP0228-20121227/13657_1 /TAXON_ID=133427 /ORGANISM="Protoceratium reticulatum, Strain CCCM 535 (=CCMP 1889)" /LENGTH=234 /DNA_ID=CAMNT_0008396097 /DNA_START=67 /DNA_END=771 /DNA_ORIENTATION=-
MAARAAVLAVTLAGFCRTSLSVSVNVENGVYKLEESNFDSALAKFPTLMVEFYAPWCGHCKALAPAYEKAARKLKKRDMPAPRLAKVDATVEGALAKKYEVTGYPTLLVFKDGKFHGKYEGGRDKNDFIHYLDSLSLPFPVGDAMRLFYTAQSVYKEIVRAAAPAKFRKYLYPLFPLLLALPFLCSIGCCFCCGGGRKPAPAKKSKSEKVSEAKGSETNDAAEGSNKEESKKED